ncbi:hypothetical protein CFN16_19665 [Pseudomonas fluorescens]|uniref:Uncharacterized protein n=1 Tax=Pseudomonas fluorescens TaxID=294 RepID=A0A345V0L2_PSEFL|nr:deaminase domain-containing protein [Pseudomonas fluorescens]AXJ06264.1 hypothetical protein CFN16_19665 [Pseudomonas fluorescens]
MQIPLTSVSETSSDTPSSAIRHKALQEEYKQLLEHLRHTPATPMALTERFMKTHPHSPLYMEEKRKPPAATDLPNTSAGYFSLAQLAVYYGLAPWDRTDEAMHQSSLHALDEKRARHALQLESGVNIDELLCAPSESERKSLRNRPRSTSLEAQLASLTDLKIKGVIREFLPATETSLIGHLVRVLPSSASVVDVQAAPTVYLEKLLQSTDADRLAQTLLEKLGWYGSKPGEETSPTVRYKMLSRAIRLWERRDTGATRDIAGYQWHKRSNYGKSYQAIWTEFETHLLNSGRASTAVEAALLAALYRFEFPSDFHRTDIPEDLPYKNSLVWVNFVHGLNLAELIEPDRLSRMTFQQLVDFPLQELAEATEQERELIAWLRFPPTMDWAIANGIVLEDAQSNYSQIDRERAIEALDQYTNRLTAAIAQMDIDSPKRQDIADREIRKVFGHQVFTTDGRKLVRYYGPANESARVPDLKQKRESLRDVYMWKGHANKNWLITRPDGETVTTATFSLDSSGAIHTTATWIPQVIRNRTFPDVNKLFENEYQSWLTTTRAAYKTLLTHLFSCLPHDDLQAMEFGETKIYTLRKATQGLEADQETASLTMPLRLRTGLILRLSNNSKTSWYECLPRAGILRKRNDITDNMLNGLLMTERWRVRTTVRVQVRRGQSVPFDWEAHEKGKLPRKGATCTAIIEQLGNTYPPESPSGYPPLMTSNRAAAIATYIAKALFYFDEDELFAVARNQTDLERLEEKRHTLLDELVNFMPFFGNLDDLDSDNPNKRIGAIFGMYSDSLSFAMPIGKFISGTLKLTSTAVRMGYRHALPQFSGLVAKLLVSSLQNFNPLDGLATLARNLIRGLYAKVRQALVRVVRLIKRLAGRTGTYDFVKSLPEVSDPGRYRLLAPSDELATTRHSADVPVRKVNSTQPFDYRVMDPLTNKPYGPPLADKTFRLSLGRSEYSALEATDQQVTVRVAESAQVRSIPEIDGRTTLFIDEVPYRLDGDSLKRIEMIDDSTTFKHSVCRIRRAPGNEVCINEFFNGGPHPDTPALGSFDEDKGYAPWFGEKICLPQARSGQTGEFFMRDGKLYQVTNGKVQAWRGDLSSLGFPSNLPVPKDQLLANLQFRKGIYGRIEIQGAYAGSDELHRIGAIVVPGADGISTHIFASPINGKYYLATVPSTDQLNQHQTYFMKLLPPVQLKTGLGEELLRVFDGSMTANNMVALHGADNVQRAMRTMETIAIPIGITDNPPANMKWVKVDTSPGEALMFDDEVRMSVNTLPAGSNVWARSRAISDAAKQRTAEIFDTLFQKKVITQGESSVFRINNTMQKLHTSLKWPLNKGNARNIAYAEVTKVDGTREIYVSVSGGKKITKNLPLFKSHPGTGRVQLGDTTYINVDWQASWPMSSLVLDADDSLLAIPRTPMTLPPQPTSLDSESKLIATIRNAYPDRRSISSINIATTMAPCESCAVVMKAFGHTGEDIPLNVIWN